MKICFLAPSNSAHTKKWCGYFVSQGHEVHVVSFFADEIEGVQVHYVSTGAAADGGDMQKLLYLTKAMQVRKIVKQIKPDVVNVHYATSYGTVAALAGIKNYALSVWGSDIFDFPRRSALHRMLLKFSLMRARYLFSTSRAMADEAALYTKKKFEITPFGVDMELFAPDKRDREKDDLFVVGTVKGLAPAYGIDLLLQAAALAKEQHPEVSLRLRIAGKGTNEQEYRELAESLGLGDTVTWLGFIPQAEAAKEWANMDLAVVFSRAESFGVSAVEAQSCGCPVVISDIPGLLEATNPGETSVAVKSGDVNALAEAIYTAYLNPEKHREMGICGRAFVRRHYEYGACFKKIEDLFLHIAGK